MVDQRDPRPPTQVELDALLAAMLGQTHCGGTDDDRETYLGWIENAWLAVWDHYITDGPGYAGKVLAVVWAGAPSFVQSYTWSKERQEWTLAGDSVQ